MPATWKLREVLNERGFYHASEISRIVQDQTGYELSIQAVCDLLNRQPKMIRVETIQALCNAFYFCLSDVLEVVPIASQKRPKNMRNMERPGLQHVKVGKTNSAERAKRARDARASPSIRKTDFAAFYPNAREFSSDS
jgi:putative transcriptional regulator